MAAERVGLAVSRVGELIEQIQGWFAGGPISAEIEVADDRLSWQVVARVKTPPPVAAWAIRVGEVAHHLRSGLNNVVYEVASQRAGGEPTKPKAIQFPICDSPAGFEDAIKQGFLGEATPILLEHVRAFQPFGVGEEFLQPGPAFLNQHPLELLQDLNNSDKHKRWRVAVIVARYFEFGPGGKSLAIGFDETPEDLDGLFLSNELPSDEVIEGAVVFRQRCRQSIKSIEGSAGIQFDAGVATTGGAVDLGQLLYGLIFVSGLIMFRMEDPDADIASIYDRLQLAMTA